MTLSDIKHSVWAGRDGINWMHMTVPAAIFSIGAQPAIAENFIIHRILTPHKAATAAKKGNAVQAKRKQAIVKIRVKLTKRNGLCRRALASRQWPEMSSCRFFATIGREQTR